MNFSCFGSHFNLRPSAHGEDAEVADGYGTMADFRFADGLFARADAVEEIPHVIFAVIEANGVGGKWLGQEVGVACFNFFGASYEIALNRD